MTTAANSYLSLSARRRLAAQITLAVGGFGIGTGEFAIMGLLPDIGNDLTLSAPQVGHLISAYALGVVLGAPLIAVLAAQLPRRLLLILLMAAFAAGNFASALAPSYGSVMLFRFLSGLPHGAYFGVAALVAASMVEPARRGQAVGRVMLGLTVAVLIGNPVATWLGQVSSWRMAFVFVGLIGLLTMALLRFTLPHVPASRLNSPMRELGALKLEQVWLTLGIGAIGFGGLFSVVSYIAPTLIEVSGVSAAWIPFALSFLGAGMVVGNIAGGWLADRNLMRSIGILLFWNMLMLALFPFAAGNPVTALISVFLIGTGVSIGVPLQIRLMDVAPHAQTLAASLNHSAFNMANALGAWLGGIAIAGGYGWTSTGWVGMALALGGLLIFGVAVQRAPRAAVQG
ncbi:MFS transporter [Eoetvoesiella caeni]|uniref:DHA1 family inner membrane transport protein n=1 Tax=Eoetvoesiella caeni TaxID=645616 RepID=A0A366HHN9_9BURK|nr:MFS transporter [Eoetvoesiella caeni]MCI2808434.1 MFS transporter [Eoetvoesiella caeni]NYT54975.1 MFS transporter [Eoetvoesiella caeni]RBP41052.1 DHA1 family inner membrane transport protein [Eoetvoesiella caeni]